MRTLYVSVLVLHVMVAVLGLGLIASIAVIAATALRRDAGSMNVAALLAPLFRYSAWSLAVMLVTGVLLDFAIGGAFRQRWWFRGAALLLLAIGALHAQAHRALRKELAYKSRDIVLRRVEWRAYVMCALIAAIVVLMEAKPF